MDTLDKEAYVSLATYRGNGTEVRTPVWFAHDAAAPAWLWVYTNGKSAKVKRIRRDPRARVAACDMRGTVHGDWLDAQARVLDGDAAQAPGFAALQAKYGWQMWLLTLGARVGGRWRDRTILAIELVRPYA